MIEDHEL